MLTAYATPVAPNGVSKAPATKSVTSQTSAKTAIKAAAKIPVKVPKPTEGKLEVSPARIDLFGPLARHRLVALWVRPDGSRQDVSSKVVLTSSQPKVAVVEAAKQSVVAGENGNAMLTVRFGTLSAQIYVYVSDAEKTRPVSFENDVIPAMARSGCSSGACHGANSGKGGFKLSLRGYAPELDYVSITRQLRGRRISRQAPEKSLLLRKPLLETPHGGGRILTKDSAAYATLLGWLRQGAPGIEAKTPRLTALALSPGDRLFSPKETQQTLVRATFSDGRTYDVTNQALFRSNDEAVAKISESGQITAGTPGSTAVQAKFMDKLAVLRVTVPYPQKVDAAAFKVRNNYVDDAVYAKLQQLNLEPGGPATDSEFVRRVYIDALGTLPTVEEARSFIENQENNKRDKLVEDVLKRPEFASVWALKFADLFLMRKEHMQRKNTIALQQWMTNQLRENRPWDKIANDLLTASGSTEEKPETLWYISRQQTRPNNKGWIRHHELTGEIVSQVFLGTRIGCAKCHNHPSEKYTQDDYYHFAALWAQVNGDGEGDPVPARILPKDAGEVRHPRTNQLMAPQPLDGTNLKVADKEDRRVKFVAWMTQGDGRESFARNIVNRLWARLFGAGIVEPVDDLRSTNPPRNEQLMNALAKDLIEHNYDLKYIIGVMMKSRTYGASATPTKNNRVDTQFFSHYPIRRLPAEELMDAVAQVTGVPDRFASYPVGTRAIELTDVELNSASLDTFGRPIRISPLDCERNNAPSMSQALELFNGEGLQGKLKSGEGRLAQLIKQHKENEPIVEELFLAAFARRPTTPEMTAVLAAIKAAPNREEGLQDVLWALINSKEFMFNH
ncbi:MAG TPA: DUF1549 domain-containing protein [Abditibacteriaceae bacterium]